MSLLSLRMQVDMFQLPVATTAARVARGAWSIMRQFSCAVCEPQVQRWLLGAALWVWCLLALQIRHKVCLCHH